MRKHEPVVYCFGPENETRRGISLLSVEAGYHCLHDQNTEAMIPWTIISFLKLWFCTEYWI